MPFGLPVEPLVKEINAGASPQSSSGFADAIAPDAGGGETLPLL
jgi:hypothetical protein